MYTESVLALSPAAIPNEAYACGLPVDLRFKEDTEPGELSVRAGGAPNYVLLISPGSFEQLIA
jgi:hypothetical protein